MQASLLIFGVDVSKSALMVGRCDQSAVQLLDNQRAPIDAWLSQLPKGSIIAMESTGKYHLLLARRAHCAGMVVYVLNARDLYFYAKGLGARAKTDRVDARLIARYVAQHRANLHPWRPASALHARLDDLLRRRGVVVTKLDALRQALRGCADLRAQLSQVEVTLGSVLRTIDQKVSALIQTDAELNGVRQRLAGVTGFGPQASALLTVLLTRIPFDNADALVAYSGMDPRPNDSGSRRGTRKLTKRGPAYLRKQWYLTGFSASRSKVLNATYQALRARGLAATEAFLILGRKLLRAAYAVWKSGQPFDASKLMAKSACPKL